MRPIALIILSLLVAAPAAEGATSLRYAVLPLAPEVNATEDQAARATQLLRQALGKLRGVRMLAISDDQQPKGRCDTACLVRLAQVLGADRIVTGHLMMQPKVHFPGVHWHITLSQVDRTRAGRWGRYERVYVSSTSKPKFLAEAALALRDADPTKRMPVLSPRAAQNTPEAPAIEGMVYVPPSHFIMGADFGEPNEAPRHRIWLDGFYVELYETSNARYKACVAAGVCRRSRFHDDPELGRDDHPVAGINFREATTYCRWRGRRLPTEAEWERAARGLEERRWPWGDDFDARKVNMRNPDDGWDGSAPVGSFPEGRSPVGAYNMAGNVWEWTTDWSSGNYYRRSPSKRPKGPKSGKRRIIRGGSWRYDIPFYVSAHNRSNARPGSRFTHLGVRCFKDAAQGSP